MSTKLSVLLLSLGFAIPAFAAGEDVDATKLYELSTNGSSQKVKAGADGKFVLTIQPKAGAHLSEEAPLKVELSGKSGVTVAKAKLSRADAVSKKDAAPRFEVPFKAMAEGKGGVEAKVTFFVCTANLCLRQQRDVSLSVDVD